MDRRWIFMALEFSTKKMALFLNSKPSWYHLRQKKFFLCEYPPFKIIDINLNTYLSTALLRILYSWVSNNFWSSNKGDLRYEIFTSCKHWGLACLNIWAPTWEPGTTLSIVSHVKWKVNFKLTLRHPVFNFPLNSLYSPRNHSNLTCN